LLEANEKYVDTVYNDGAGLTLAERETVRLGRQAFNRATREINRLQARQKHIQNEIAKELLFSQSQPQRADFVPPRPSSGSSRLPVRDKSSKPSELSYSLGKEVVATMPRHYQNVTTGDGDPDAVSD
jgi:hypothetical protein